MTTQTAAAAKEAPAARAAGRTEGTTAVSGGATGADQPAADRGPTSIVSGGATGADQPTADRGRTSIADLVVVKVAGIAAHEIPGVHDMGVGLSRTVGAVRDRVPGGRPNVGRGVKAEAGAHTRLRVSAAAHRTPHVR